MNYFSIDNIGSIQDIQMYTFSYRFNEIHELFFRKSALMLCGLGKNQVRWSTSTTSSNESWALFSALMNREYTIRKQDFAAYRAILRNLLSGSSLPRTKHNCCVPLHSATNAIDLLRSSSDVICRPPRKFCIG